MPVKLGDRVKDMLSDFEGVVTARSEFLYGCVRVQVTSRGLHEGKPIEPYWFDEPQLEVIEIEPEAKKPPQGGGSGDNPPSRDCP